jgi:hypothetical protein
MGNGIYIDLEINSCSKQYIRLLSSLTLHISSKTKETFPLILKEKK